MSRGNGVRFHLPDGPDQRARDEVMVSTFGLSPDIDRLYGRAGAEGPAVRSC